jgi:hypothetical protein
MTTAAHVPYSIYPNPRKRNVVYNIKLDKKKGRQSECMHRAECMHQSMVIKSSRKTLSNYCNGILTDDGDCACSASSCMDHAILMVGFDNTSDPAYFKFKKLLGTGWGEDGYFWVAQTEKGPYGLFGILAQGVVPEIAYNVTAQVFDDPQDTPLVPWAWLLIVLACVMACMCCTGFLKKMKDGREEGGAPEREK